MPFSVHMDKETLLAIEALAKKSGKTRNALINEAVRGFVKSQATPAWPKEVQEWIASGSKRDSAKMPSFESYRGELAEQGEPVL